MLVALGLSFASVLKCNTSTKGMINHAQRKKQVKSEIRLSIKWHSRENQLK